MKKIIVFISIVSISIYLIINLLNYSETKDTNTLKFTSWGTQSEVSIIKETIEEFEKQNNIKVEFIHIPQNYFQKLHLLFASNLEPDVLFINNQNIQLYIEANLLEDLTNYFPRIDNEYNKIALNCFKKDNKLYAIPRDISNLVLYYNKDIFKEKNINLNKQINTLSELKDIAQKVSSEKNFGINFEEDPIYWLYYLAANGGGAISDDKKSVIINSNKSIEALNLYSDFQLKEHIAPNKAQIGSMTTAQMFINKKLAMYLGGRWMFPIFSKTINFDWDIMEFPSSETNKVYIDSSGWAISKKSKNKEKALKLIKFLSSYETTNKFLKSGLIVPARVDSTKVFLSESKKNKVFIDMLKNTKPTPVNKNYNKINDILKEKSKIFFAGNTKFKKVFDEKTIKNLESLL